MRTWLFACLPVAMAAHTASAQLPDFIPDSVPETKSAVTATENGKIYIETSINTSKKTSNNPQSSANLAIDTNLTKKLWSDWRVGINARLDLDLARGTGLTKDNLGLTLREVIASKRIDELVIDIGRINVRDGVALGYNPSDVFRTGALLIRRTEDPARLRESRLGVTGIRLSLDSKGGGFAAMFVPAITSSQNPSWYDPRWGATNGEHEQYYLKWTPPSLNGIYTNLLIHKVSKNAATLGFNATNNFGQSSVGYIEVARTHQTDVIDIANNNTTLRQARTKLATGFTYATESRKTFTIEYNYNGNGLRKEIWDNQWQKLSSDDLGRGFADAGRHQESIGRHSFLMSLQWERFASRDDDLSCLLKANLIDRSSFCYCEWTLRKSTSELSISASKYFGNDYSEYGAAQQQWALGAKVRIYF